MPRRLFARLLVHSALVLLVLLVTAGLALDQFLTRNEIVRLGDQVARYALLLKEDTAKTPAGSLQSAIVRMGRVANLRFTVVDRGGRVLADSERDPAAMENHAQHPEVADALAGHQGRSIRRSATLGIEMLYVAVPGDPVVRAAVPMTQVRAILSEVRQRIVLASIPAALVALGLSVLLVRSVSRRMEGMIRFSSAIARGEFDAELRPGGDDELADLERGLLALRDEIRGRVDTLDRERDTLAALAEGLPHAVVVLAADRKVVLTNGLAQNLLRLREEEARGLPAAEVLRIPRILDALDAVGPGVEPEAFLVEWLDPHLHLEVILRPLPDRSGRPGVLLVLRDVTRRVHLERVRTDFVANLSHELRTPLTAIRGSAETLLDSEQADPTVSRKFLETIRRNALRLESLLRDVSELSRVESGAAPLEVAAFDGGQVVRRAAELFAAEAQKVGVALEARGREETLTLASDEGKVESILINLVQNGVRYTPPGGRVTVAAEPAQGGVLFSVEDTGVGIPSRDLSRVTERFYRADPGRSRATGGTGLGLAIVKHLTEILGGTLDIRSEAGRGTRVTVFVPSKIAT